MGLSGVGVKGASKEVDVQLHYFMQLTCHSSTNDKHISPTQTDRHWLGRANQAEAQMLKKVATKCKPSKS